MRDMILDAVCAVVIFEAVLALAYVGLCIYSAYLGWKNEQMERDFLDMLREDSEREDA